MNDIKQEIENTVDNLVADFLYYNRKEDPDLPRGAIEQAIKDGVVTSDQIVKWFEKSLKEGL